MDRTHLALKFENAVDLDTGVVFAGGSPRLEPIQHVLPGVRQKQRRRLSEDCTELLLITRRLFRTLARRFIAARQNRFDIVLEGVPADGLHHCGLGRPRLPRRGRTLQ